ncbi:hypothetical protein EZS27_041028 [termite gut metagenome]|uniref:DUF5655 domain-containing protein n=1 Tax=termite gut metagenome TaxID=433724 RepID=A0A5J4PCX5_9ZZZZ
MATFVNYGYINYEIMTWICPVCGRTFNRRGQSHSCYGNNPLTLADAFAGYKEHWLPLYFELKERTGHKTGTFTEFFPSTGVMWKHPSTFAMIRCKHEAMEIEFYSHKLQMERNPVRYLKNSKYR